MGCTSELGGNVGVVWIVQDDSDLNHILNDGPTPPYVVVMGREHYIRDNLLEFKAKRDRVAGVVLLVRADDDEKHYSTPFSPDYQCPNQYSGLYVNDTQYDRCKANLWQEKSSISGLLYDDIPYPIFLFNEQKSIENLERCFKSNNLAKGLQRKQDSYPLCSMQLDSFMLAASDTKTCINSHSLLDELFQVNGQRCYTVENQNIFAYLKPAIGPAKPIGSDILKPELVEPQSIVMLITKLSSLSMFTKISPGADSTITSIVTLLAIAEALGKIQNDTKVVESKRNIAFALLDSEPFDYTGSSRMVYNMKNDSFPVSHFYTKNATETEALKNLNLKSIDYVINLDQLANYQNSDRINLHIDPRSIDSTKLSEATKIFNQVSKSEKVNFNQGDPKLPLPPTPVHEFIKQSRTNTTEANLFGVVLSNYDTKYSNLQYNSIFDDYKNIHQTSKEQLVEHLTKVASFIAKSLYKLAFKDDDTGKIMVDKMTIENLLDCYLVHSNCTLFTKAWQAGQQLPGGPIQTYKDPTNRSDDMNGLITYHLLAYFIGEKMKFNLTECYAEDKKSMTHNYQYINGQGEPIEDIKSGLCIRSQVHVSPSTSPAFAVTEDGITVDERYPAWTVSLDGMRNRKPRIFLRPSPVQQWCIFLLGIVTSLMAFVTVYHIKTSISRLQVDSETQPGTST